ncbi:MAG TPA: hypothetical protein VGH28_33475, partial [Polyangiaceae bacterium]
MRAKLVSTALFVFAVASACTNLPELAPNRCGNEVVDPPEDCDTFGNASGPGGTCITTGSDACHFGCDPSVTDTTSADACPSGYTCSATGVCRRPSGAFDPTPTTIADSNTANTTRVLAGDFDGDHAADVVSVGTTSYVHFFDGRTEALRVPLSSLSTKPTTPALGPLGDPATDTRTSAVMVSTFTGFGGVSGGNLRVWRGATDRTLLPTVFPGLDLTTLTQSLGNQLSDGRMLQAVRAGEADIFAIINPTGTFDLDYVIGPGSPPASAPQPIFQDVPSPSDIAGAIPVGKLGGTCATSPLPAIMLCDNVVVAKMGDAVARVYPTCDGAIPPGVNLVGGANRTAEIDLKLNDGSSSDVVAGPAFIATPPATSMNPAPAPSVFVVGAKNVWQFASTPCDIARTGKIVGEVMPIAPQKVLAVGYIDKLDSCVDWVGDDGIHVMTLSNGATPACAPVPVADAPAPWIDARIGDFNANSLPDVVAISSTSLDFYNGSGQPLLNGEHTIL